MPSAWLKWHKARWATAMVPDQSSNVPHAGVGGMPSLAMRETLSPADYFIDEEGSFYCDHGCLSIEEHEGRV